MRAGQEVADLGFRRGNALSSVFKEMHLLAHRANQTTLQVLAVKRPDDGWSVRIPLD